MGLAAVLDFCVVFLDIKNAHNEYKCSAAQDPMLRQDEHGFICPEMGRNSQREGG